MVILTGHIFTIWGIHVQEMLAPLELPPISPKMVTRSKQMENILLISEMDQSFFHLSLLPSRRALRLLAVPWIMR